jgi:hypothetical protein
MNDFFFWIEGLGFSTFMRESNSLFAFPMFLYLHTLALAIVAGAAAIICLGVIGVWPKRAPISALQAMYPVVWIGFALSAVTGICIFMKDASTYGNNTDFYVKLVFVLASMVLLFQIRSRVLRNPEIVGATIPAGAKALAWASLLCWILATVTGRLIAYTNPIPGGF